MASQQARQSRSVRNSTHESRGIFFLDATNPRMVDAAASEGTDRMKPINPNRQTTVDRMNQPGSPSIAVISEETGVSKHTLYAWLARDRRLSQNDKNSTNGRIMTKRFKPRSPSIKFALLAESHSLTGAELKEFCNQREVSFEELLSWRDLALSGIEIADRDGIGSTRKAHDQIVRSLEEDLKRKNEALAEAAALLILQKKTLGILGGAK